MSEKKRINIKLFLTWLMSISPYPELVLRRNSKILRWTKTKIKKNKKNVHIQDDEQREKIKKDFFVLLAEFIDDSKLVIVHSSMQSLSMIYDNPLDIINDIRKIIGNEGTIVVPTHVESNDNNEIFIDFKTTARTVTTGLLPSIFLRLENVVRSEFPLNNISAQGPLANEIVKNNLQTNLAHGKGSAWHYCYKKDASILFLGVKSRDSTTMVHVAEDLLDQDWPIKNWHEEKKTKINGVEFKIRKRRECFQKFNTSFYRSHQLKVNKLLTEIDFNGIPVGFIKSSKSTVDYIITRTLNKKSFFKVPKKYWRKL